MSERKHALRGWHNVSSHNQHRSSQTKTTWRKKMHWTKQITKPTDENKSSIPTIPTEPTNKKRDIKCSNAFPPIHFSRPGGMRDRLNPPPPAGDGVLRTLLKCLKSIIMHLEQVRAFRRAALHKAQKKVPKIPFVFCCLSGPILRDFGPKIGAQISPKWFQNLFF